jgi:hypothetical protein
MPPQEAIEILKQFNAWRRDENIRNSHEMPNPKEVGIAIDTLIQTVQDQEACIKNMESALSSIYSSIY